MTLITDTEALAAFCAPAEKRRVRRDRYRVHARAHLLADPVPGAGRGTRRGRRDRRAGARSRPGAAARADGGSRRSSRCFTRRGRTSRSSFSCPGKVPHPVFDTQIAAMVCGFGDCGQLRDAGAAAGRRRARQGLALHRLGAAALDRAADPATRWPTSSICARSTSGCSRSSARTAAPAGSPKRWTIWSIRRSTAPTRTRHGGASGCAARPTGGFSAC